MIALARVYAAFDPTDGMRVLVDRLWPRGLGRDAAHIDEWAKDVAPSPELRRWYKHRPERFAEFEVRYRAELARPNLAQMLERLCDQGRGGTLTLLTATHDPHMSHAAVLRQVLIERACASPSGQSATRPFA